MMKITKVIALIIISGVGLAACGTQSPKATPTVEASKTLPPTDISTSTPTSTPEPTMTPTSTPETSLELGEMQEVSEGGFSFQPVNGYLYEVDGAGVGIFDQDRTIIISVFGDLSYTGNQTNEEIIDDFLGELVERGAAEFEKGKPYPLIIDEFEGIAIDLSGTFFNFPFEGQTVLVMPSKNQYLYGLAIANQGVQKTKWFDEGQGVFSTILESIEFLEIQDFGGSACPVSSDGTYGYTEDNPIRVGGDAFEGPARERAYLDSLIGPNGGSVSYERSGSFGHGDTILDIYNVTFEGSSVTLYLDEYSFEELMAPNGFYCWRVIPLSAP